MKTMTIQDIDVSLVLADEAWSGLLGLGADESGGEALFVPLVHATFESADTARFAGRPVELAVVLSDDSHVQDLNRQFRGKDAPTNVLSFALTDETDGATPDVPGEPVALGDVILARQTVEREAIEQSKALIDHSRHLVVHGVLHLLGYDHLEEEGAVEMEALEARILARFGIANPYAETAEGSPEPPEGTTEGR